MDKHSVKIYNCNVQLHHAGLWYSGVASKSVTAICCFCLSKVDARHEYKRKDLTAMDLPCPSVMIHHYKRAGNEGGCNHKEDNYTR